MKVSGNAEYSLCIHKVQCDCSIPFESRVRYLIEKYKGAAFSSVYPTSPKPVSWNALALGVSKAHEANGGTFDAVPDVPYHKRK